MTDFVEHISTLGSFMRNLGGTKEEVDHRLEPFLGEFQELIPALKYRNGWFTEENVRLSLANWGEQLRKEGIEQWLANYSIKDSGKRIGIIMAGNIPMVGFHDLLCVLASGNIALVKLSSDDTILIRKLAILLSTMDPSYNQRIVFVDKLESIDAVIATGSNNSARYFEHYFGKYPHIIRKNRNSVAVLDGSESEEELKNLGKDVFQYFGLGCRNVSKLYLPKGYNLDLFFGAIFEGFQDIRYHNKYANNYDYYKALFLLEQVELIENGFLLLKEDTSMASPVGVLHYEYYDGIDKLKQRLKEDAAQIQCVATHLQLENSVPFGKTQQPSLSDYADGIDTMKFLCSV